VLPYCGHFDRFVAEGFGDQLKNTSHDVFATGTRACSNSGSDAEPSSDLIGRPCSDCRHTTIKLGEVAVALLKQPPESRNQTVIGAHSGQVCIGV